MAGWQVVHGGVNSVEDSARVSLCPLFVTDDVEFAHHECARGLFPKASHTPCVSILF